MGSCLSSDREYIPKTYRAAFNINQKREQIVRGYNQAILEETGKEHLYAKDHDEIVMAYAIFGPWGFSCDCKNAIKTQSNTQAVVSCDDNEGNQIDHHIIIGQRRDIDDPFWANDEASKTRIQVQNIRSKVSCWLLLDDCIMDFEKNFKSEYWGEERCGLTVYKSGGMYQYDTIKGTSIVQDTDEAPLYGFNGNGYFIIDIDSKRERAKISFISDWSNSGPSKHFDLKGTRNILPVITLYHDNETVSIQHIS